MKKIALLILGVILFSSCEKEENSVLKPPVISFYKGIDGWTHQPTFVYSDTTLNGVTHKYLRVNFAASSCIKHMLVTNNGAVLLDHEEDNETMFNSTFQVELRAESLPTTFNLHFEVLDYDGQKTAKDLTVNFN